MCSRKDSSTAALILLREGEEEEVRQAEAASAIPRPKPPKRVFRLVLRSQALEAELHLHVFTDYLRPPLLLVGAVLCCAFHGLRSAGELARAVCWEKVQRFRIGAMCSGKSRVR